MLDIKIIRNNPELVKDSIKKRNIDLDLDKFLEIDSEKLKLLVEVDELRAIKNKVSKEIPTLSDEEKNKKISEMKIVSDKIKLIEEKLKSINDEFNLMHRNIPNFLHKDIPEGIDDTENIVLKKVGKLKEFDFKPKDHHEIGILKDFIDKKKAAEVTGARFYYLKGDLVLLQNAIANFTISVLTSEDILKKIIKENNLNVSSKTFTPIIPPLMANYKTMEKMGRLHPMDDRYCHPEDEQALIGSAEHTLGAIHMGEVLNEDDLPIRYFANTPAFRREAGTYGKDSRGIFRVHQFDKIEMEIFSTSETGEDEQKLMVAIQSYLTEQLGLPHQIVDICTGDIGKPDYKQFDIETFFPGQDAYRETHTSDYMTDFQSYSLDTKVKLNNGTKEYAHMNDATAFALGRIIAAVMENYQTAEGNVKIPDVLVPFMGGKTEI